MIARLVEARLHLSPIMNSRYDLVDDSIKFQISRYTWLEGGAAATLVSPWMIQLNSRFLGTCDWRAKQLLLRHPNEISGRTWLEGGAAATPTS